ncbi:Protein MGR2 [Wickerhamiella sorbophila]|uniref:Protein MGR2 n=1 Tax=Wickerhamiella sorbophila TaxID=45607 RepID=A0A2T0FI68_9ASCO|nr:Protein MGR2 [Wickerhamiella sorbophila]PRT54639.1 Protein MGR2 [Wickerhamiella sorbophila]
MPPVQRIPQGQHEPSILEKMKMGAIMGATAGTIIGVMFGGISIYQNGPGPNGYMRTMGQFIGGSAAMFGLFMSIGSMIRSEGRSPEEWRMMYQASLQRGIKRD